MKVRMLHQVTGTRDGVDWPKPGEVLDVPESEAAGLLANGIAEAADGPELESAQVDTKPAPKKAAGPEKADA